MNIKKICNNLENHISSLQHQSRKEELANSIIHGIGVGLSIAALVVLIVFGAIHGTAWHVVGFSVFGSTLIFLYLSSTFFHGSKSTKKKNFFRFFDYSGIFLLIAGTYTPIALVFMRGPWGWTIFGVAWGLAIVGIVLRIVFPKNIELLLAVFYILMGWIILVAIKPLFSLVPPIVIFWLFLGGLNYMLGFIFLSWKRLPYHHAIWHLFVLGGSICHFFGLLFGIK